MSEEKSTTLENKEVSSALSSNDDVVTLKSELAELKSILMANQKNNEKKDFFQQETEANEYNQKMQNIEAQAKEIAEMEIKLSHLVPKQTFDNAKKSLAEISNNKDKLNFLYKLAYATKNGKEKLEEFDALGEEGKKIRALDSLEALERQRNSIPFTEINNQTMTRKDVLNKIQDDIKKYHSERGSNFVQYI